MANGDLRLWPDYYSIYPPYQQTSAAPNPMQSVAEQMGVDPISKLADAINNLADALRARDD